LYGFAVGFVQQSFATVFKQAGSAQHDGAGRRNRARRFAGMTRKLLAWMFGLALLLGATREARAENVLKFGSLAPSQSPWAQVLNTWARAVDAKSNHSLKLQFFWNGTQGDEAAMVGKVKSGQLQGLAATAVGLGKIHKPILVVQVPGVFDSWAKLDAARAALMGDFQQGARDKGFHILGWGDVGRMHWYSKGFAVTSPGSLRGQKPYVWRDDDIHRTLFGAIPGVTAVPLGVPEVLPALNSGAVNAAHTPALTCGQLQWVSRFSNIVADGDAFMIGALVISESVLQGLSEDERQILTDTGAVAANALTQRIRNEDDAALARQREKLEVHQFSDAEKAEWMALYKTVRERLGQQNVFPPDLISRVEGLGR
jgi:TRAP-type C4-dicarboxylate transport system substrate-binding protein